MTWARKYWANFSLSFVLSASKPGCRADESTAPPGGSQFSQNVKTGSRIPTSPGVVDARLMAG